MPQKYPLVQGMCVGTHRGVNPWRVALRMGRLHPAVGQALSGLSTPCGTGGHRDASSVEQAQGSAPLNCRYQGAAQGQHGAAPGVEHGLDELDGPARTQGARDHLELARPERAQDVVGEPSHPQPGSGLVRGHLVQQQTRDGGHVHLLLPPCALGVHGGAHAGGADAVGVHGGLAEADVEGQGIVGDGGRGGGGDVGHGPKSARTTTTAGDVPAGGHRPSRRGRLEPHSGIVMT